MSLILIRFGVSHIEDGLGKISSVTSLLVLLYILVGASVVNCKSISSISLFSITTGKILPRKKKKKKLC